MTPDELQTVTEIYIKARAANACAVALDPNNAALWDELCESATFAGDQETAEKALWKSIALNPNRVRPYSWGLEIYEKKWFGDAAKRHKVAQLASNASFARPAETMKMASILKREGYPEYANKLAMKVPPQERKFEKQRR